ncbi:MAG: hypothetical protein JNL60_15770 [Bacteroidia bacterium]|nr:hypothetical protein [Bacteroidia bacterium]
MWFSCAKKQVPADNNLLGLDYYPDVLGKYVIYDVDSTVYTENPKDTLVFKYRIKEKLVERFTDSEQKQAIRLERYIKKYNPLKSYDSIPWQVKETWMVNADNISVKVLENNVRYTKLIFPIQEKVSWNGNAYNTIGEWTYTYDYIDKKETINGNALPNVLLVNQKNYRTLISYQNYSEKYAKGIGLVQKQITDLLSNTIVSNVVVEDRIESGLIYKQILVTYGYE